MIARSLQDAMTFVRSVEANRSTAALTLDHLLQEQITVIQGDSSSSRVDNKGADRGKRISRLDRLDQIANEVAAAVKAVRDVGEDRDRLAELGLVNEDAAAQKQVIEESNTDPAEVS